MDQRNGAWISNTDAETWEEDEETGGLVHMLRADDAVQVGLWRAGEQANTPIEVTLEGDESLVVLAGSGEVRVDDGDPIELRPGVMVSMPKGARTAWVVDEEFKEFWVYS